MTKTNSQSYISKAITGLLGLLWIVFTPLAQAELLSGYTGCTSENRFENQCLPNVSNIEKKLNNLSEDLVKMDADRHSWKGFDEDSWARPSDDATAYIDLETVKEIFQSPEKIIALFSGDTDHITALQKAKKHLQSIQYIDNSRGERYLITSISDETEYDAAAIQLIRADYFGTTETVKDMLATQRLLNEDDEVAKFNHPGGSQLIGEYLFLALEDFDLPRDPPRTGVWQIDREQVGINFKYSVEHPPVGDVPSKDYHQSTAAVTKLSDETFLLAVCVYEECDYINFYKSEKTTLDENPGFKFIDQWDRYAEGAWIPPDEDNTQNLDVDNWSDCDPQNMNFAVQDDGDIYLVMFGGETIDGIDTCKTLIGFDDHLYGYKVNIDAIDAPDGVDGVDGVDEHEEMLYTTKLKPTNKVDVIPNPTACTSPTHIFVPRFHSLNLLAGSGLWLRPEGRNTIAFLATEHYDSCGSWDRPVNAETRWGVSENWNDAPLISVDHTIVAVDEGDLAANTGTYPASEIITLSASVGTIVQGASAGSWRWFWHTIDGPDDSQTVTITRTDSTGELNSTTFELVVNNVSPAANAGPDKVLECVDGMWAFPNASGSTDPGADTLSFAWSFTAVPESILPAFDDPTIAAPSFQLLDLGTYVVEVTVTDDDGAADSDTVLISFEDTKPPVISSLSAIPSVLFPPNHKMVPVEFSISATDRCDLEPVCSISSIVSNEPSGDSTDIKITGDLTAKLRAERFGSGSGRIYTVTVECADAKGNAIAEMTTVTVPHDKGKKKKSEKKSKANKN
ncbi:MAG: hypothetical protein JRE28_02495 [Deltaproteobacteria bacterium]|nr:hypothetical protein [Deltaproteobacteria bacterium]